MSSEKRKRRIPHNVRGGGIYELAHMYRSPFAWSRETISNVRDQGADPSTNGRKPTARIYVSKIRRRIEIVDDMTGILDLDDFIAVGTEEASRDSGKVVGDRVSSYNHVDPDVGGNKHVGKLSCLAACIEEKACVEYYSNNGRNGHYLHMDFDGWEIFEHDLPFQIIDKAEALPYVGLKVIITNVRDECLNINALVKAISKYFAILLSKKKIQVFVYDVDRSNKEIQVQKPEGFETKGEETHPSLEMPDGGSIRVNLQILDDPVFGDNIDIYRQGIYVTSRHVPYLVKGYEDWDGKDSVLTRDAIGDNPDYFEKTDRYYAPRYPPEWKPEKKKQMGEKQKEALVRVIEEVCTAISKVHPELLIELIGYETPFGLEGKILKNPRPSKEKPEDWEEATITYGPDGQPIIPTGTGARPPGPGEGEGEPPTGTVDPDGTNTGKVPKEKPTDPDQPRLVMPEVDIMDAKFGDLIPTVSARVIAEEKRLEILLNQSKPASSIFRKSQSIDRYREVSYKEFISAIIKLKYSNNNLDEFEKVKDEIWNALFSGGSIIQKQTEQMRSTMKPKPKAGSSSRNKST